MQLILSSRILDDVYEVCHRCLVWPPESVPLALQRLSPGDSTEALYISMEPPLDLPAHFRASLRAHMLIARMRV